MRELKYYVACSVDGFIARQNGSLDFFLPEGEHLADLMTSFPETVPTHVRKTLSVHAENRCFDTVLMGRRTYQVGLDAGITSPYGHLRQVLFSRTVTSSPDKNVELVSGDTLSFVRRLKKETGKDIWLCGGAELATALFPEVDELILKVNPVLIGSGIPLFSAAVERTSLRLVSSKTYTNGFIMSRYRTEHLRDPSL
jgi:dihydrofolate reductase